MDSFDSLNTLILP